MNAGMIRITKLTGEKEMPRFIEFKGLINSIRIVAKISKAMKRVYGKDVTFTTVNKSDGGWTDIAWLDGVELMEIDYQMNVA